MWYAYRITTLFIALFKDASTASYIPPFYYIQSMSKQCIKALISGRVQGVFFRESTRREAMKLEITGYAKNLADGTVEVIACGEEAALTQFTRWLHHGPEYANVEQVQIQAKVLRPFTDFTTG